MNEKTILLPLMSIFLFTACEPNITNQNEIVFNESDGTSLKWIGKISDAQNCNDDFRQLFYLNGSWETSTEYDTCWIYPDSPPTLYECSSIKLYLDMNSYADESNGNYYYYDKLLTYNLYSDRTVTHVYPYIDIREWVWEELEEE